MGVWVSLSVCMCDCGYMSVDGCLWVSLSVMGVYGYLWVSLSGMGVYLCLWVFMSVYPCYRCLWVLYGCLGPIPIALHRLP